jgi:sensor histidine kinase YesM
MESIKNMFKAVSRYLAKKLRQAIEYSTGLMIQTFGNDDKPMTFKSLFVGMTGLMILIGVCLGTCIAEVLVAAALTYLLAPFLGIAVANLFAVFFSCFWMFYIIDLSAPIPAY